MINSRVPRRVGRLFRTLALLLILAVAGVLLWRVFFSVKIPGNVKTLTVNAKTREAYAKAGENMIFRTQEQGTITRGERSYGYFSVVQCVFLPDAEQVQIVFRYNNSTIRHLAEDYDLDGIPSREETLYDVTLVISSDADGEQKTKRIRPTEEDTVRETTALYTFYRYTFDGVDAESAGAVFADIYYVGDVDYDAEAYGTLRLADRDSEWLTYRLSGADRKALAGD